MDLPANQPERAAEVRDPKMAHVSVVHEPERVSNGQATQKMHVGGALAVCAELAGRQHGVVHRGQLLAAGLTPEKIKGMARSGALHRLHRGVYAVGHLALPPFAHEQAAILACGEPSLISSRSALYLWGLAARPSDVHVIALGHHCRKRVGIHLRLLAAIDDRDVRRRHGLPLTSPARSLIDLAATAGPVELEDLVAGARVRRLVGEGELEAALARAGKARGAAAMRRFLAEEGGSDMTRSIAERRFRRCLRQAELPQPKTNRKVAGYEVDFLWEAEKVAVEVDGWRFHGHRRAFERDRRKDMILTGAGYLVIRVTWRQFTEQLLVVITHVARMLDRRRSAEPPEPAHAEAPKP